MAKGNKRNDNYFRKSIEELGPNFIDEKTVEALSRDCPRIIKDMAFGKIQYSDYVGYIAHPKLINILLEYVNRKLLFHSASAEALNYYTSYIYNSGIPISIEVDNAKTVHNALAYAYSQIYSALYTLKDNPDPNILLIMTSNIRDYSNYIVKY